LLGGGVKKPYGDYDSSIQLIESELFDIAGFNKLYFAGHPEGNKDIDPDGSTKNIDEALSWKNDFRNRTDADMAITTQFCFDSKTVINWANDIKDKGINIPIHIGIAGPAKLQTLLRYSIECGVGASIKILQKRALDLTKLLLPYKPTNILSELAEYKFNNPDFNIEKVHFFPLGGVKQVSKFVEDIT
jgi:methylenetetrahydrofolate reductase (NADPH)